MPTVVRDSRKRSPFWYACYTDATGRRLKKSTGQTVKAKALEVCRGLQRAEMLGRERALRRLQMPNDLQTLDEIAWRPLPGPQTDFCRSTAREVCLGGGAGSGKSDALLAASLSQIDNPEYSGLILRQSYPQLRDLLARAQILFRAVGGEYRASEHTWHFRSKARIEFSHLDESAGGRWQFLGRQFAFIGIDEAGQLATDGTDASGQPVSSVYLFLLTRLRVRAVAFARRQD